MSVPKSLTDLSIGAVPLRLHPCSPGYFTHTCGVLLTFWILERCTRIFNCKASRNSPMIL